MCSRAASMMAVEVLRCSIQQQPGIGVVMNLTRRLTVPHAGSFSLSVRARRLAGFKVRNRPPTNNQRTEVRPTGRNPGSLFGRPLLLPLLSGSPCCCRCRPFSIVCFSFFFPVVCCRFPPRHYGAPEKTRRTLPTSNRALSRLLRRGR